MSPENLNHLMPDGFVLEGTEPKVSSRHVADLAEMPHRKVLRKVRNLLATVAQINGTKNGLVEFAPVESAYTDDKGETRVEYLLTADEAVILQSTFTGERGVRTVAVLLAEIHRLRQQLAAVELRAIRAERDYHEAQNELLRRDNFEKAHAIKKIGEFADRYRPRVAFGEPSEASGLPRTIPRRGSLCAPPRPKYNPDQLELEFVDLAEWGLAQ